MNNCVAFTLPNVASTSRFAALVAAHLKAPLQIGLKGDLGSGKTTFVRELCRELGIGSPVSSPTYVLQHVYEGPQLIVEHWDLYRCNSAPEELLDPAPDNTIRLIEWPEKCPEILQHCPHLLHFEYTFDSQTPLDRRVSMLGFKPEITDYVQKAWNHP